LTAESFSFLSFLFIRISPSLFCSIVNFKFQSWYFLSRKMNWMRPNWVTLLTSDYLPFV
jgi:hypothetical protein